LTIFGSGASRTILQGSSVGVLLTGNLPVTLSGVTITQGGQSAIVIMQGSLTLENCVVSDSSSPGNPFSQGGGITNNQGILVIKGTTLTNNKGRFGGGIANIGGITTIIQSTITSNSVGSNEDGGGIASDEWSDYGYQINDQRQFGGDWRWDLK